MCDGKIRPDKDGWVYLTEPVPVEMCGVIEFQDHVRSMDGNATEWKRVDGLSMFVGFPHRVRFKRGWVKVTSKVPDSVMHLFDWCQGDKPREWCPSNGAVQPPLWTDLGKTHPKFYYWLRPKDQSIGLPADAEAPERDAPESDAAFQRRILLTLIQTVIVRTDGKNGLVLCDKPELPAADYLRLAGMICNEGSG